MSNIWPLFAGKFGSEDFQKWPNLVALDHPMEMCERQLSLSRYLRTI